MTRKRRRAYQRRKRTHTREGLSSTSGSRPQTSIQDPRTPALNPEHLPLAAEDFLCQASEVPIGHLPWIVELFRQEEFVPFQNRLMSICLERIIEQPARYEQVRVIRRLVFGRGDTLLIARTGWSKSVIFHIFSVITGKITLQIIPLNKLGQEQFQQIRRIDGTRPCLVTARTRSEEKDLLERIEAGQYTHILLGPEQASSRAFRAALRSPTLQVQLGLVAIDECHLIEQWQTFRPEFMMLGQLRAILLPDVVWFACSATIDEATERTVLQYSGLRPVGPDMYQTEVIRTSIDRKDISICVRPLPRNKVTSAETLFFTIAEAVTSLEARPSDIPKTIIFIDSKTDIERVVVYLRRMLVSQSAQYPVNRRYVQDLSAKERSVCNIIQVYTSSVSDWDQEQRYAEFQKESSLIRVMVATTALGMGVNIPDVSRVVLWRFPIDFDVGDVQQRIGRGGRGPGRTSQAYILVPYYAFDSEGTEPAVPESGMSSAPVVTRTSDVMAQPAHLATSTQAELSNPTHARLSQTQGTTSKRTWTGLELEYRRRLPTAFKEMVNAKCHRSAILRVLGEEKLPSGSSRSEVSPELCCSGCNPSLFPSFPGPPTLETVVQKPAKGTSAGVALEVLDKWAIEQAKLFYSSPHRRYPLSPAAFLEVDCRYRLARLFEPHRKVAWRYFSIDDAEREAPRLRHWRHRDGSITLLVEQLRRMGSTIGGTVSEIARIKRDERAAASERLARITFTPLSPSLGRRDFAEWLKEKDDNLARQVARRIFRQRIVQAAPALPPTDPPTQTQLSAIRPDRYETPDAPTASPLSQPATFSSPLAPEFSPLSTPGHLTSRAREVLTSTPEIVARLREKYRRHSQSLLSQRWVTPLRDVASQNESSQDVSSEVLLSQATSAHDQLHDVEGVLSQDSASLPSGDFEIALVQSAFTETPTQPRFQHQSPSKDPQDVDAELQEHRHSHRAPLREKDPNVGFPTFSPSKSRGRIRTLTPKAKENARGTLDRC